ncbi:MAG: H-NS histone family protein [Rhodobacteraceae bacterium]|nr:H-NS histone family protein [Paracoccaceae bacterium]
MKVDLKGLSKKDLEKLAADVSKAIEKQEKDLRADALAAAEKAAAKFGYSLNDLMGAPKGRKTAKAKAKYKNPDDKTQTWSGRGRQPAWFKAAIESGKSPEELSV